MGSKRFAAAGGLRLLLRSAAAWLISAAVLLPIASGILASAETGSAILGYVSSVLSFLTALAAGAAAREKGRDRNLPQLFVTLLFLPIALLTVGLLIRGKELNPSGVLSVVSFSLAGVWLGWLLSGIAFKPKRRRKAFGKRAAVGRFP